MTTMPPKDIELSSIDLERHALVKMNPRGFKIRHPPPPHELNSFITPKEKLFLTMHMGVAVVNKQDYRLVIDGLVNEPLNLTLRQLMKLPATSITAMHECYGSPLKPPTDALWRVGNVRWTGVKLSYLLEMAGSKLSSEEGFIWSDGLDRGPFAGVEADRFQKDLPMRKALRPEVLVAYMMNEEPLDKERGGPMRLVVPGWFGTNSTKWLSRLSVQRHRATGPYTTRFYNEIDPTDAEGGKTRPVWMIEVNSMITRPLPGEKYIEPDVKVEGWAWSDAGISKVELSDNNGATWTVAPVEKRLEYGWQHFEVRMELQPGPHSLIARAQCSTGELQPLAGRRNHVHRVDIEVTPLMLSHN